MTTPTTFIPKPLHKCIYDVSRAYRDALADPSSCIARDLRVLAKFAYAFNEPDCTRSKAGCRQMCDDYDRAFKMLVIGGYAPVTTLTEARRHAI